MSHPDAGDQSLQEEPPSAWEWLVAAIGLVLLVASIGYLTYDAVAGNGDVPVPTLRVTGIEPQGTHFLVRLQVVNAGRATAADLRVDGELRRDGEVVERSETTFDYLPGRSAREAGLFFRHDPRALELVLTARSYQQP